MVAVSEVPPRPQAGAGARVEPIRFMASALKYAALRRFWVAPKNGLKLPAFRIHFRLSQSITASRMTRYDFVLMSFHAGTG